MAHVDNRVAVVGAGYAGMAAAVTLAEHGIPVTVLESGPVPGGRARRVVSHGHELDNGQHIFVGAYSELFRLMRTVGVPSDALLRIPLEIRYADGFAFRALWLPPPLGLLAGLLAARGVPLAERLGALRFIAALRDTLAGGADASDLLLPRVDLSRLFPEPAAEFVRAHGGDMRLGTTVRDLVSLKTQFQKIIVAVGPHQLKTLLPDLANDFTYQPIYTCYLQYPENTRLDFPMVGMAEGLVQWVFDRGALLGEKGRLACVISAQGDHQQMTQDEVAATCDRELRSAFPALPSPLWTRAIAEKRATISCTPGLKRPEVRTPITGVFLAGDYTDPEYPPTLEAAVRSGIRAAELALSSAS